MNNEQISALLDHNAELRAENARLREALKECIELIDTIDHAFPTHSAPKVLRMAKETLRK